MQRPVGAIYGCLSRQLFPKHPSLLQPRAFSTLDSQYLQLGEWGNLTAKKVVPQTLSNSLKIQPDIPLDIPPEIPKNQPSIPLIKPEISKLDPEKMDGEVLSIKPVVPKPNIVKKPAYLSFMDLFEMNRPQEAKKRYRSLKANGDEIDPFIYNVMIQGFVRINNRIDAIAVYKDYVSKNSPGALLSVYNTMIAAHVYWRDIEKASETFQNMIQADVAPDGVTFNNLIMGYFQVGDVDRAVNVFDLLRRSKDVPVTDILCNTMISGLIRTGNLEPAKKFYETLGQAGVKPTPSTFNSLLNGLMLAKDYNGALKILGDMTQSRVKPDTYILTTLISRLPAKEAANILALMKKANIPPTTATFGAVISGWARQGNLEAAEKAFLEMRNYNLEPDIRIYTSLMEAYFKTGNFKVAVATFTRMLQDGILPNRSAFDTIIAGFVSHDHISDAIACFREMKQQGVGRTRSTYWVLLEALMDYNMVAEVGEVLADMDETDFVPNSPSLAKLVDRAREMTSNHSLTHS